MPGNTDLQRRRKREAVQGVALFAVIQLAVIGVMVGLCFIPGMPGWCVALFGALAVLSGVSLIGAALVLRQRFREIERGELDAASEY